MTSIWSVKDRLALLTADRDARPSLPRNELVAICGQPPFFDADPINPLTGARNDNRGFTSVLLTKLVQLRDQAVDGFVLHRHVQCSSFCVLSNLHQVSVAETCDYAAMDGFWIIGFLLPVDRSMKVAAKVTAQT